jgi:choline dehydrogenase
MAYQRGTVESFDLWATLVGDKSYSWRSFLPYMQKSVHFTAPPAGKRAANATAAVDLKTIGPNKGPVSLTFSNYAMAISSYVQKGFAEIGIRPTNGFASGTLNGSSYVLETIDESTQTRESSETAFLTPALSRDNLIVFAHTLAKKVVFDSKKRATGVSVETGGKVYTLSAKNEVVLSAGAFQSPQLLMVSGVGPKATLDQFKIPVVNNLPGVGQNMWVSIHLLVWVSSKVRNTDNCRTMCISALAIRSMLSLARHFRTPPLQKRL